MKKNTIRILANILSAMPEGTMLDNPLYDGAPTTRERIPATELYDELIAELNKGAEQKAQNDALYASAKEIVLSELGETPVTVAELYEAVEDKLPEGFTKAKVQYALGHYWESEVVKHEGKVNSYTRT